MDSRIIQEKIKVLKNSAISKIIKEKIQEFERCGRKNCNAIFKELCFCILTANFDAERAIKIQKEIDDDFIFLDENELSKKLRIMGYRFPNIRAKFIAGAQKYKNNIKDIIQSFTDNYELREWFVKNIKGLGYKESGHLLRNIGFKDFAIIDFHIIDILVKYDFIERPKTLTRKKYMEIEELLKNIANEVELNLAELDLYLWYLETGKIFK
jgi:N-glycosylase/DNA lyase